MILLQCAPKIDGLTDDGEEMMQRPYPLTAYENSGRVLGSPTVHRVLGFVRDLYREEIDVDWDEAMAGDLSVLVGMYVITQNHDGSVGTHVTALEEVRRYPGNETWS